jgi:hypothetical protein
MNYFATRVVGQKNTNVKERERLDELMTLHTPLPNDRKECTLEP